MARSKAAQAGSCLVSTMPPFAEVPCTKMTTCPVVIGALKKPNKAKFSYCYYIYIHIYRSKWKELLRVARVLGKCVLSSVAVFITPAPAEPPGTSPKPIGAAIQTHKNKHENIREQTTHGVYARFCLQYVYLYIYICMCR